jgi:site-specific recombinase XerD
VIELFPRYELYARARGFNEDYIQQVRRVVRFFDGFMPPETEINQISADDFRRFILYLKDRPLWEGKKGQASQTLSATSINTYTRAVKAFFSWAASEGIIANNPLAEVPAYRKPKTLPKIYTEDELRAIFRVIENDLRNQAFIYTFLDSGIRLGELNKLDMNDIDLAAGIIKVHGKGGKDRYSYLPPTTLAIINRYVKRYRNAATKNEPLFTTKDGRAISLAGIQSLLARIGQKAGIKERLAPHKLRHTMATYSLKYGGNLDYVRRILGHSSDQTTSDSYLNPRSEDIQAAHRKFSPVENLRSPINGNEIIMKKTASGAYQEENAEGVAKGLKKFEIAERSDRQNTRHPRPSHIAQGETNEGPSITEEEKGPYLGDLRLRPLHKDLYWGHQRKLLELTDRLIRDVQDLKRLMAAFEKYRKWGSKYKVGSLFEVLLEIQKSEYRQLWPFLLKHLNDEFCDPPLEEQLTKIVFDPNWSDAGKQEPLNTSIGHVLENLFLVKERGTLQGTCRICENYFLRDISS